MARRQEEPEVELTEEERERIRDEERERARVQEARVDETPVDERRHDRDDERRARDEEHRDHGEHRHATGAPRVRGGLSLGSILTGMAVALGAMFLLTALVGGIAVAVGLTTDVQATPTQIGWGLGIALVLSQFLAYLWGGYSAGRMARGAGVLNGLLVPVAALLLVGVAAGIVAAFGADARFAAPFTALRIPVEQDFVQPPRSTCSRP